MRKDRFIVGIICLALSAWILFVGTTGGIVAPAIVLAVLGIWGGNRGGEGMWSKVVIFWH